MTTAPRERLEQIWRNAWRPPDRRPPWAWCEEHITSIPYSPIPGRFRSANSPWMREPMEALVDPKIRIVSIIAAIQSGKTSVGELGLAHIIANHPGPTLWLDQTDEVARVVASTGTTLPARITPAGDSQQAPQASSLNELVAQYEQLVSDHKPVEAAAFYQQHLAKHFTR